MSRSLCRTLVYALLLAATATASAQVRISGLISDSETGESLPGSTVQVEDTFQGAVSNANGRFFLILRKIPAVLLVRHIGYRTERVVVSQTENRTFDIRLKASPVLLEEVVVSGEDPAVEIMRRVLAAKQASRDSVRSMYAEVYTRFWLFREFDPIQMSESIRSLYWKPGRGNRELIRARRKRPPGSGVFRFVGPDYVPNLYDDEVALNGNVYVTPTHPDALSLYTFILEGKRKLDDAIVWDINFSPRDLSLTAFTGHLAVLDSVYAMLEIEARPHPSTAFLPPVQYHDVRYEQRFVGLKNGIYAPLDFHARGSVGFGRLGASYPPARYEQLSSVSNYAIDAPVPDSMFSDDRRQRLHPLVDHQEYLFVRNPTITPLTPREAELLASINPRLSVDRAFRPEGLLRLYTAVRVTEENEEEQPPETIVGRAIDHSWTWYNRVDGWHPGLAGSVASRFGARLDIRGGYSVERKDPTGRIRLSQSIGIVPFSARVFAETGDETRTVGQGSEYGLLVPGLMTYTGFDDYFDYYRRREVAAGVILSNPLETIRIGLSGHLEDHTSLSKNDRFNGWFIRNEQRENPAIPEGTLGSFQATLDAESSTRSIGLNVQFERAKNSFFDSDFDYTSFQGSAYLKTNTFFRSRERPNTIRLSVKAGTATDGIPIQRYGIIDGSTGPWAPSGTFRGLDDRHVAGYRYAAFFWEHDFSTALFERLGLWRLATGGSGIVLFGAHAKVFDPGVTSGWMNELGVGWTFPFRLPIRLDLATRLDESGVFVRIGKTRL